jgi:glycerophosphoryl diester phosphodiesterase
MASQRPSVIAHRGASAHEAENSLAAFRRAISVGADGIELDVHASLDGQLFVHHDAELPGLGPISRLPAQEARRHRLANGERIPTLEEALAAIGDHDVWVELKTLDARFDDALLRTLDQGPAPDRYAVHAFDHRIVARLGRHRPDLPRGVLLSSYLLHPLAPLLETGATTLWQEQHLIDADLVERLHASRFTIIAWTVNSTADITRLLSLGVDGLCGNWPERIRQAAGP